MSMYALLLATRDHLRKVCSLEHGECTIQPGGNPPSHMGQRHVSVDENNLLPGEESHLKEVYLVDITITIRTGQFTRDTYDEIYEAHAGELDELERRIKTAIHGNHTLRSLANKYAKAPSTEGGDIFQRPLYYSAWSKIVPRGPEWTGEESDLENDRDTFITRTLTFTGGDRLQSLTNMR